MEPDGRALPGVTIKSVGARGSTERTVAILHMGSVEGVQPLICKIISFGGLTNEISRLNTTRKSSLKPVIQDQHRAVTYHSVSVTIGAV